MKGDDGFGPALIQKLKQSDNMICIDAGPAPENYTGKIIKENPDTILILDAVHLGKNPGKYEILSPSEIVKSGFTTHDMSPSLFLDYLKNETNADIYLLGIQPANIEFGANMSDIVKTKIDKIAKELNNA